MGAAGADHPEREEIARNRHLIPSGKTVASDGR
jgi:hypothetical protein